MDDAEAAPVSRTGMWLRLGVSVALAVGFALALAPYVSTVPRNLSVPPWVIVAYLATLLPYHLLRAGRWVFLIRPMAPISVRDATLGSLAGYMWIAILPFRLGEFARPLFCAQRSELPVSQSLGAVALERVVDGLGVCALFFLGTAGLEPSAQSRALVQGTTVVVGAFTTALVLLAIMGRFPSLAGRVVAGVVSPVSARLAHTVSGTVTAALPSVGPLAGFVATTVAYWLVNATGMWLLARGCSLPLSWLDVVTVLAVMNLALLIPGGPAQFGVFQTGVALGLSLYLSPDVVKDTGSVFAFYLYVCQLGTIAVLGLWAQRVLDLDWRTLFRRRRRAGDAEP